MVGMIWRRPLFARPKLLISSIQRLCLPIPDQRSQPPRSMARAARAQSTARPSANAGTLGELDFRPVAQHEAQRLRQLLGPADYDFFSNHAVLDLGGDVQDLAVLQHDGVFQLAIANFATVIDGREGTDVGFDNPAALADDGGAPDHAVADFRAGFDDDLRS